MLLHDQNKKTITCVNCNITIFCESISYRVAVGDIPCSCIKEYYSKYYNKKKKDYNEKNNT